MSENHDEQPTELTYPNETVNTIQLVVYDSDWEQTAEPNVRWEDITFTLVKQHLSSDKENDGGLIKLKLKKMLETAIQSLKYSLPMSHLLLEQQNELIEVLLLAADQFKNVPDSARPFTKYLKKEDWYVIEALITSEPLMKSLTKLLTSPDRKSVV